MLLQGMNIGLNASGIHALLETLHFDSMVRNTMQSNNDTTDRHNEACNLDSTQRVADNA